MEWIFVAVIAGSIVTSGHSTEEQCLGRKAIIEKDNKIVGTCIKAPSHGTTWTSGSLATTSTPNTIAFIGTTDYGFLLAVTTQPTSVRLEKSLRESLKRLAKERRWSMSVLIQQVLEAWVKKEDSK